MQETQTRLEPRAPSPPPSPPEMEDADRGKHIDLVLNQGKDLDGNPIDLKAEPAEGAKQINLKGARLEGAELKGAHLEGADLRGAQLEGAILVDAHLEGAMLHKAHLERRHRILGHRPAVAPSSGSRSTIKLPEVVSTHGRL